MSKKYETSIHTFEKKLTVCDIIFFFQKRSMILLDQIQYKHIIIERERKRERERERESEHACIYVAVFCQYKKRSRAT
jgi:hypothetical protein